VRLNHIRVGSGEPLLLVHGLGSHYQVWEPVMERLSAEREVIGVDLPGFGDSPPLPDDGTPDAYQLTDAVQGFLDDLGWDRPHIAGNSLGGWVGLEMGRTGGAASVTALSPAGLWSQALGERPNDTRALARRLRPLVSAATFLPPLRRRMLATFAARPERIPLAAGRELVLGWVDSNGYDGANRAMRTHLFDPTGYPEQVPVTIAWAELDRLVGPPKPHRRPPQTRFLVLPGVGHTPMWDDPELVARTLLEGSAVSAPVA
jgi:pimeloyl-ACP methyl ester carboxylesterase